MDTKDCKIGQKVVVTEAPSQVFYIQSMSEAGVVVGYDVLERDHMGVPFEYTVSIQGVDPVCLSPYPLTKP